AAPDCHAAVRAASTNLGSLRRFCGCEISGAMIFAPFAEKLADYLFYWHFLNVDVAHVAGFEQFTAGFGDFRAWNLQLHGHRRLFRYFTEGGKIACRLFFEGETQNL